MKRERGERMGTEIMRERERKMREKDERER